MSDAGITKWVGVLAILIGLGVIFMPTYLMVLLGLYLLIVGLLLLLSKKALLISAVLIVVGAGVIYFASQIIYMVALFMVVFGLFIALLQPAKGNRAVGLAIALFGALSFILPAFLSTIVGVILIIGGLYLVLGGEVKEVVKEVPIVKHFPELKKLR